MTDPSDLLRALGYGDRWQALMNETSDPDAVPGRVIRRDRGRALVATEEQLSAVATDRHPELAVGDWVSVARGEVERILPRKGSLRRKGPTGSEQVLAANVDLVLLVCGLDRPVKAGRIHRGSVQAWDAGAEPIVILNKSDLHDDPGAVAEAVASQTLGLDVLCTSTDTGDGIERLRAAIGDRTAVLMGESGAGKSSLLNALAGRVLAEAGRVRVADSKGRHTTAHRELHVLPGGGVVIDTPGIRSLGLAASAEAVEATFEDIENLALQCRFSDCAHEGEPGCAIKAAVEEGGLSAERLQAYRRLHREVTQEELRSKPHQRRRREKQFTRMVRDVKKEKGHKFPGKH